MLESGPMMYVFKADDRLRGTSFEGHCDPLSDGSFVMTTYIKYVDRKNRLKEVVIVQDIACAVDHLIDDFKCDWFVFNKRPFNQYYL